MIGGIPYAIPWLGDWHVVGGITPPLTGFIELEPTLSLVELEGAPGVGLALLE